MTITAIGFTNKFYTLWEITEETRPLGNGHNCIVTHYNYIKNISFDKETALAKYPNAIFDDNLRGKTISWESTKEVWDNVDVYRFGKYKYEKIDNRELNYLAWYWNNIYEEDHKKFVEDVLTANGYEIRTYTYTNLVTGEEVSSKHLITPEDLEIEHQNNKEFNMTLAELEAGNPINVFIKSNPDSEGNYNDGNVNYHFQEVKENWYSGFTYYLPVLNGKAKRIKNKNIIIKNYTYTVNNNVINIEVLDFEIVK